MSGDEFEDGLYVYPLLPLVERRRVPRIAVELRGEHTALLTDTGADALAATMMLAATAGEVHPILLFDADTGERISVSPTGLEHQTRIAEALRLQAEIARMCERADAARNLFAELGDDWHSEHAIDYAFEEGLRAGGVTAPPDEALLAKVRDQVIPNAALMAFAGFHAADEDRDGFAWAGAEDCWVASAFLVSFAYCAGLEHADSLR